MPNLRGKQHNLPLGRIYFAHAPSLVIQTWVPGLDFCPSTKILAQTRRLIVASGPFY